MFTDLWVYKSRAGKRLGGSIQWAEEKSSSTLEIHRNRYVAHQRVYAASLGS